MIPCTNDLADPNVMGLWYPGTFYCPDWNDDHHLYQTYRANVHTWIRLAVHRCDPERRALKGKECASETAINDFFSSRVFTMQMQRQAPNLEYKENIQEFSRKYFVDTFYNHPMNNVTAIGKEYNVR